MIILVIHMVITLMIITIMIIIIFNMLIMKFSCEHNCAHKTLGTTSEGLEALSRPPFARRAPSPREYFKATARGPRRLLVA